MSKDKPRQPQIFKESKRIMIDVCLPVEVDGYLGDTNTLTRVACMILNKRQNELKERGKGWLHYQPVLKEELE